MSRTLKTGDKFVHTKYDIVYTLEKTTSYGFCEFIVHLKLGDRRDSFYYDQVIHMLDEGTWVHYENYFKNKFIKEFIYDG